jgi:hypothetical protein
MSLENSIMTNDSINLDEEVYGTMIYRQISRSMESRKLQEKTRTKRNSKNKKKVKRKSALIDNVYYHTDDEEYVWKQHDCHRSTSFPLFSNQSDDEFIKSKTKERCYHHHKSKSAPADCALYDNHDSPSHTSENTEMDYIQ